jgi:hypothetical protein
MCRNIRPLHNFAPPATEDEVRAAALQYVRKISGTTKPSKANAAAFEQAVDAVAEVSRRLLGELVTTARRRTARSRRPRRRSARRSASPSRPRRGVTPVVLRGMARVARHTKLTADEGRGGDVAERLLRAADALRDDPGCELYLVSRQRDAPDVVWVTELWRSQADLERVAADAGEGDDVAEVIAMMRDVAVVELDHAGGKGPAGEA